jgi:hypothetical protein
MSNARPRGPSGSPKKPESPALSSLPRCPNCGREPAVVFPHLREYDRSVTDAPLVCLECCFEARDRR